MTGVAAKNLLPKVCATRVGGACGFFASRRANPTASSAVAAVALVWLDCRSGEALCAAYRLRRRLGATWLPSPCHWRYRCRHMRRPHWSRWPIRRQGMKASVPTRRSGAVAVFVTPTTASGLGLSSAEMGCNFE